MWWTTEKSRSGASSVLVPRPTYTSVLRAELRAFAEILRHSIGDLDVFVDNQQSVDGVALGQECCCAAQRDGAGSWRKVWRCLDDLTNVNVLKVKARLSFDDVMSGRPIV